MNLKKFLVAGMAVLALAACKKDDVEVPEKVQEGTTYMSVAIQLPSSVYSNIRADGKEDEEHNYIGEWAGRDKIEEVIVYILSDGQKKVETMLFGADPGTKEVGFSDDGVYTANAWKTTPGNKKLYAVVNPTTTIKKRLNPDNVNANNFDKEFRKAYKDVSSTNMWAKEESTGAEKKDVIVMSGEPVSIYVDNNVSREDVTTKGKNTASINVRRGIARVIATLDNSIAVNEKGEVLVQSKDRSTTFGVLKDLKWTVAQYEKDMCLIPQIDGTPVTNWAIQTMTPGYFYTEVDNVEYLTPTAKALTLYDYSRVAEEQRKELKKYIRVNPTPGESTEDVNKIVDLDDMQFVTETTHKYGDSGVTGYRKGNTPYVMIVGTFSPDKSRFAAGQVSKYNEGDNIYLGAIDGKYYVELTPEAKEANKVSEEDKANGKDGFKEFKTGKMYYFAWLNPDKLDHMKWLNSPVIRNNIYHINITGFIKEGLTGNPYHPGDDNPDKPDKDDPTPTPDEELKDSETNMRTEITVIPWGVHSYDIKF